MRPTDRREFLRLATAALAAGPSACRSRAPAPPAIPRPLTLDLPTGRNAALVPGDTPIQHVVVIVKENRTYDALFGAFPEGEPHLHAQTPRCSAVIGDEEDVPHDRETALHPERHVRCHHSIDVAATYHQLARNYALCARYFSEVRGPSFPNHLMLIAGQAPLHDDPQAGPETWKCPEHCYDFPTFAEQFTRAGRSWRSYDETGFVSSFWMIRQLQHSPNIVPWRQFAVDARAGTLPNLAYVFNEWADSEHPPFSLCRGMTWTLAQIRAVAEGPAWDRTAIFVTWDDWGGFHDHISPPIVERDDRGRPLRYGDRVPCLVISPYAKPGYISVVPHSHLSLMRFAEQIFGIPPLNDRTAQASAMADCFDFTQPPRRPVLPPDPRCEPT